MRRHLGCTRPDGLGLGMIDVAQGTELPTCRNGRPCGYSRAGLLGHIAEVHVGIPRRS